MDFRDTSGDDEAGDDGADPSVMEEVACVEECIRIAWQSTADITDRNLARFHRLLMKKSGCEDYRELRWYFRDLARDVGHEWLAVKLAQAFPSIDLDGVAVNVCDMRALVMSACKQAASTLGREINRGAMDSRGQMPRFIYQPHMAEARRSWARLLAEHGVDHTQAGVRLFATKPNGVLMDFLLSTQSVWDGLNTSIRKHCETAHAIGHARGAAVLQQMRKAVA